MATVLGPFVFYSEPAHQKPALVVHGTREDANPLVNDKLHSYTVTARRDLAHRFEFSAPSVLLAVVELRRV